MDNKQYKEIEIAKIIIPEKRARATFTLEQEAELKASIKTYGFYIPILVRPVADGKYELIDGEHRIKVVKEMGWTKIPAIIGTTDENKAAILNFLANTARGTQNPVDIAEALDKTKQAGLSIEELSAATGHTKDWVEFYLTIVKLPDVYKDALRVGKLKVGHIREAIKLPRPTDTDQLLGEVIKTGFSVVAIKTIVERYLQDEKVKQFKNGELTKPEELPAFDTSRLIQYDDCMTCHQKVPKGNTWMKVICNDCLALLTYLVENVGDPKAALDIVFKALKEKMERENFEKLKQKFEPKVKKTEIPPKKEGEFPGPTSG